MPRKRQVPGLEAGTAYGQVSAQTDAMDESKGGISLEGGAAPELVGAPVPGPVPALAAPAAPGPGVLEQAQAFTPNLTPLTAPGTGMSRGLSRPPPTPNQEAADMLRQWAEASEDVQFRAVLSESAAQLSS